MKDIRMRKKLFGITLLLTLTLVGCTQKPNSNAEANTLQQTEENASVDENTNEKEDETLENDATSENNEKGNAENDQAAKTAQDFTFADLKNTEFAFSSGVRAWGNELYIYKDGSFDGLYHDADMGVNGDDYPDGTRYSSIYQGDFDKEIEIVDDYTVKLKLKNLRYKDEVGTEELADNVKYIYSEAYGLENTDTFYLYLPGKPIETLDENVLSWILRGDSAEGKLEYYVLYNEKEGDAFYSYDTSITDRINYAISIAEAYDELYSEQLRNANTQLDMNLFSGKLYETWDTALNKVWKLTSAKLSDTEMESLRAEERQWVSDKEAVLENSDYEGGSAAPLDRNIKAADLTKERVYELQKK